MATSAVCPGAPARNRDLYDQVNIGQSDRTDLRTDFARLPHLLDQREEHRKLKQRKLILAFGNPMVRRDLFGAKPNKEHPDVLLQEDNHAQAKKAKKAKKAGILPRPSRNNQVKQNLFAVFHNPRIQNGGLFD